MESWSRSLDLRSLAERFGTPLYLHHPPTLRTRFRAYLGLVGEPGNVLYPIKANPSPVVVRTVAELGGGADCAASSEVRIAQAAGIPLERISYTTPAFDPELGAGLLAAGASVVADSPQALAALAGRPELRPRPGRSEGGGARPAGRLLVRVNPGALPGYRTASDVQRFTAHGAGTSQFGIPSEELVEHLADYPLRVSGLHLHVGTQMDNVETFVEGLRFLHRLADLLAERTSHRIEVLNLGGGLGIPFLDQDAFPSVDDLRAALAPLLRPGLVYQVEPGNSLVGESAGLLTRVVATKTTRGKRWAIVDVGTDQLVKFTVARWEHQVVGPDHRPLPRAGPDGLAGPLCFAGDVLFPETDVSGLAPGDPLLVQHAGAYCEAVSSRFNGRRAPAQVVVDDGGEAHLARTREDPFFDPAHQTFQPALWRPERFAPEGGEALPSERVHALESAYMHRLANLDVYDVVEVRRTGPGTYVVEMELRAEVGFVAMPFAVRLAGDATIIAVGHELGWTEKSGPVWATRLSLTCSGTLPVAGRLRCLVELGALAPDPRGGAARIGEAHFRLGDGQVSGVAAVVVPAPPPGAKAPQPARVESVWR